MSAMEKSDLPEVAEKRANKAAWAAAQLVGRRAGTKENTELQSRVRTQSRGSTGGTMQSDLIFLTTSAKGSFTIFDPFWTSNIVPTA
jgi:hypothetical protein